MIGAAHRPPSGGPEPPDDFFNVGAVDSDEMAQRVGRTPEPLLDGKVSPHEAERRRKARQAAALEAEIVDEETEVSPVGDATPDEGG